MSTRGLLVRKRVMWVFFGTTLIFVLLLGRIGYIHFIWSDELSRKALDMRMQDIPIQARRGTIYDRNGRELAFSIDVESVFALPAQVKDPEKAAEQLSGLLGMKKETILNKLTRKSCYEWIKRKVPDEIIKQIKALRIPGIGFTQESLRVFPKGTLLANVLGIAGIDNQGLEGLEFQYDKVLAGEQGRSTVEVDAIGEAIPGAVKEYVPPTPGNNLVLTVDEVIQFIAERELDNAVARSQAKGGVIIAMDPSNGEILAMAVRPTYDPNRYDEYPAENRRLIAITDAFPPGSMFKPITLAAALESGAVTMQDSFYCPGFIKVDQEILNCWGPAHGSQSTVEIVENSCNVGFITVGLRTGTDAFYKYLEAFNLTGPTGIDLPGEGTGIIPPKEDVKPVDLACMSFGQTLTLTPLQVITAISAIANGGNLVVPHVVKEIRETDGTVVQTMSYPVKRIISERTSEELRLALEQVVSKGTGKQAYIPGYRAAGKTGTSNKIVGGRIAEGKYIASFVGFAPANQPRVALLVMIDEPQGAYWGSQVAAPTFSAVMRDVLRYMEVPPQEEPAPEGGEKRVTVPDVKGLDVAIAHGELKKAGLSGSKEGTGSRVMDQSPPPGVAVREGTTVILYTDESAEKSGFVEVPSLIGLTLTQAREKLRERGLLMGASGSGFVASQDPPAGTRVPQGTMVKVLLRMDVGATSR